MQSLRFPSKFIWGAAADRRIEGFALADGEGPAGRQRFRHRPGAAHNGGATGAACDRRCDRDFALMRELGIRHCQLSLAWSRIVSDGRGAVNQAGLDFYHRIFDALDHHGITPWVTLFQRKLPPALEGRGGWQGRHAVEASARYADAVVRACSNHVKNWITFSELPCFTRPDGRAGSHVSGGRGEGEAMVNQAYHHALVCHGHGVRAVREHGGRGAQAGLIDHPVVPVPLDFQLQNVAAARRAFVAENSRVLNPLFRGRYSAACLRAAGAAAPNIVRGDFQLIARSLDFIGLDLRAGHFMHAGKGGPPKRPASSENYPPSHSGRLRPQALYWGPRFFTEVYGPLPIYITKPDTACRPDETAPHGGTAGLSRPEDGRDGLRELRSSMSDGAFVKGCFLERFMDGFEPEDGAERRAGRVRHEVTLRRHTSNLGTRPNALAFRKTH
jgi:beta-glucosidase